MKPAALGIDVGTTNVKVAVVAVDPGPRVIARASSPYPGLRPRPGWVEQSPDDWWAAVLSSVQRCGAALERVRAVGVSGQGSTFAPCEVSGRPIGNAIGWQDLRALAEAARSNDASDRPWTARMGTGSATRRSRSSCGSCATTPSAWNGRRSSSRPRR